MGTLDADGLANVRRALGAYSDTWTDADLAALADELSASGVLLQQAVLGWCYRDLLGIEAAKQVDVADGITSTKFSQAWQHLKTLADLYEPALRIAGGLGFESSDALIAYAVKPRERLRRAYDGDVDDRRYRSRYW